MRSLVVLVAWLLALGFARPAHADARDAAEPGEELVVSLLTFGPGDHPFTKFGHNGLLVEDKRLGTSLVYNYGTFSFGSVWLIPKFLLGRYRYWLSVQPFDQTLAAYAAQNRSVTAQELRLSPEQKRSMLTFLEWNARDENKYYVFDYYRDNCATRIRDLVDKTTAGALARVSTGPAEMTWRQHTDRLTADDLPIFLGLHIAMGSLIDRPIRVWDEMFLPSKVAEGMRAAGLVASEKVLVQDRRPPARARPPSWTLPSLVAGASGAALLVALGHFAARSSLARVAFGIAVGAVGLLFGALGCFFVFLWAFTNHEVAYHNENILQCAPFALFLAGAGVGVARGRPVAVRTVFLLGAGGVACSALGLASKTLPWLSQDNALVIAFALPVWVGLALASRLAGRSDHS
jgi:hypothetical protein